MGIDLKLLIVDGYMSDEFSFSHTIMEFGRIYDVFELLDKKAFFRDIKLATYLATISNGPMTGEYCYGVITETPYGNKLTYIYAKDLIEVMKYYEGHFNFNTRACIAYVRELPSYNLIGLYYH